MISTACNSREAYQRVNRKTIIFDGGFHAVNRFRRHAKELQSSLLSAHFLICVFGDETFQSLASMKAAVRGSRHGRNALLLLAAIVPAFVVILGQTHQ